MDTIYLLIPLALVLLVLSVWAFFWAVKHDQFEDLDREANRILFDEDLPARRKPVPADAKSDFTSATESGTDKRPAASNVSQDPQD